MESWGAHDRLTVLPPGLLKPLLPKPIFSLPSPSHHLTSIFLVAKNTLFQKYQGKITSNFHNVLIIKREFYLLRKVWKRSFKSVTGKKFSFVLRSEFQSVSGAIWSGGNAAVRHGPLTFRLPFWLAPVWVLSACSPRAARASCWCKEALVFHSSLWGWPNVSFRGPDT